MKNAQYYIDEHAADIDLTDIKLLKMKNDIEEYNKSLLAFDDNKEIYLYFIVKSIFIIIIIFNYLPNELIGIVILIMIFKGIIAKKYSSYMETYYRSFNMKVLRQSLLKQNVKRAEMKADRASRADS